SVYERTDLALSVTIPMTSMQISNDESSKGVRGNYRYISSIYERNNLKPLLGRARGYNRAEIRDRLRNIDACDERSKSVVSPVKSNRLLVPTVSSKQPSLIPDGCTNEMEGVNYFVRAFEDRYDTINLIWYIGTLQDAVKNLLNAQENRPLIIYVHHDRSICVNIFVEQVLGNSSIIEYLNSNFVMWPWDITTDSNKKDLFDSLSSLIDVNLVIQLSSVDLDRYPLLIVLSKEYNEIKMLTIIQGHLNADEVYDLLIQTRDKSEKSSSTLFSMKLNGIISSLDDDDDGSTRTSNTEEPMDFNSTSYSYIQGLKFNQPYKGSVLSAKNPHLVTIQLADDLEYMQRFLKTLDDYYKCRINDPRFELSHEFIRLNLCCVCYEVTAQKWSRSQILNFDYNTCDLYLVDSGIWLESVPHNQLRYITTQYQQEPVRNLTCRLADIEPINKTHQNKWSNQSIDQFHSIIQKYGQKCEFEIIRQFNRFYYAISLILTPKHSSCICLNDHLVSTKQAKLSVNYYSDNLFDENSLSVHPVVHEYIRQGDLKSENEIIEEMNLCAYIKVVQATYFDRLIFVHFKSRQVWIPCLTISHILCRLNQNTIEYLAIKNNFEYVAISAIEYPKLYANILRALNERQSLDDINGQINLYSIDFVIFILTKYRYEESITYELLHQANNPLVSHNKTFWSQNNIDRKTKELSCNSP
ncbi:unnamed protein product, partial [Didymodactylos carnosus]